MPSITVRGLDEHVLERIRALAEVERRSLNSELLVLIDRALERELHFAGHRNAPVPKETQLRMWRHMSGWWEDERSTDEIISDIHAARTPGREVEL
ncbi:MAG: Arc family DNA-binding protein [Spirochaetaceae bacterium]|nr:Arc family DNA-binding protein [Spirochaetaceae bacterium]MDE0217823.1 Arc family DNA-binding protein [Spirochaetaceae bacterium]